MKTIHIFATLFAVAIYTMTASAQANAVEFENGGCCDRTYTQVVCQDVRGYADNTLTVSILSGGIIGITRAVVTEGTLLGAKTLGTVQVTRRERPVNLELAAEMADKPEAILYSGNKFRLQIDMRRNHNDQYVGRLQAKIAGQMFEEEMTCRFNE